MTDLEISKALALAIGWEETEVKVSPYTGALLVFWNVDSCSVWQRFDYRDWNVIGPIAQRHDAWPKQVAPTLWSVRIASPRGALNLHADTPQKAIALAVIQGAKK